MRSKARSAEKRSDSNSEAVLEGISPAVEVLQENISKIQDWSVELTSELKELNEKVSSLEHETAYLKGYVDYDSRGKYNPPVVVEDKVKLDLPAPLIKKPVPKVPESVMDAREQFKMDTAKRPKR